MPLSSKTRVLVADDHEILLDRVLSVLRSFQVIGKVNNGRDLVDEALRLKPDVIISDITMPILNGIEAAHKLREAGSASRFVFLTVHDQPALLRACFAEGALGYVTKSRLSMDLIPAIHEALSGRPFISPSIPR